jgi:hypothetical protein
MAKRTSAKFYISTTPSDRAAAHAAKRPGAFCSELQDFFRYEELRQEGVGKKCAEDKEEERFMGLWLGTSSTT